MDRRDFLVEIIRCRPQGLETFDLGPVPYAEPLDVTAYAELDGLGAINRAVDRDLAFFKTGDTTITFDNPDGYFDDVFDPIVMTPTTIWSLRVSRDGEVNFWGVLIGKGSIKFNRKERQCEVTAYGLTKLLDMTDGWIVQRSLPAAGWALNGVHSPAGGGVLTLTPNASDLLTSDILHITDHTNGEDVTVRQRTGVTTVQLEAPLVNTYASGTIVTLKTPGHRFQSIPYLVEALFAAAGVPMAEIKLDDSQFDKLAPTPVNLEGISLLNNPRRGMTQYAGNWHADIHFGDGYSQDDPTEAWSTQGLPDQGVYDWTPYFTQAEQAALDTSTVGLPTGEPVKAFEPVVGATQEAALGARFATYWGALDCISSPLRIWGYGMGIIPSNVQQRTSVGGVVWGAPTTIALPADNDVSHLEAGLEYDPGRNFLFCAWAARTSTNRHFRYYDLTGAAWTDCKQGDDDADTGYFGPRYCKELDGVLVLRCDGSGVGPVFEICLFRGSTRVWKRPFPPCLITTAVTDNPYFYPTRTIRMVEGSLYCTLVSDGKVQLVRSDDEFETYVMRVLAPGTTSTIIMATRVGATYRIGCYRGSSPKGYYICAPLYAGVVEYADFEDISVAEALKKLAVVANALFWVDDDLQGHFVARDLYDPGAVEDISDRLMERSDVPIWDQTAQYVTASGSGAEATSGDAGFASEGIELESSFISSEAFAQALADSYFDFYSAARQWMETPVFDADGRIFRPLDRVLIDGERFLVYESDHDLGNDEVQLSLLEDR